MIPSVDPEEPATKITWLSKLGEVKFTSAPPEDGLTAGDWAGLAVMTFFVLSAVGYTCFVIFKLCESWGLM